MNHRKIEEAAALYALGALEEMERTQVELHLDTCSACRALVQLEMDTIGAMARETPEAAPPETLRARVLETAARTGQPRPKGERRWRRGWAWLSLTPAPRAAAMFGGAAVLLLAVLLGLVISQQGNLSGLRSDNDRLTVLLENQQQQLQGQQGLLRDQVGANDRIADMVAEQQAVLADQQTMSYLLAVPGLVKYGLRASPEAAPARGLLVTNASKTWGMVMLLEMPQLQPGTAYAIWLNGGGQSVRAGAVREILESTGYGQLYINSFPRPLSNFESVYVTVEPSSNGAPIGPALLSASLS